MTVTDFERELVCTGCDAIRIVIEIPEPYLNPDEYRCPDCLDQEAAERQTYERATSPFQTPPVAAPVPYDTFPKGY